MDMKKNLLKTKKIQENINAKLDYEVKNTVNAKNDRIAIFKRIPNEDYYFPYNPSALAYCLDVTNENFKRIENNINFRLLDSIGQREIRNQYNRLPNLFKQIKIKEKGKIKINNDMLIFEHEKLNLKPLNYNSSYNHINIYELITNTPESNKRLWEKLNIKL
jgi:hypothetical protein